MCIPSHIMEAYSYCRNIQQLDESRLSVKERDARRLYICMYDICIPKNTYINEYVNMYVYI